MCSIEDKLIINNVMPEFYHRFVDETITTQSSQDAADDFLNTLNQCHPSIEFTMEIEADGQLPFLGMQVIRSNQHLETKVHIKPTNTGLLLHYDSHVDKRYKRSLLTTMLTRAFRLSSTWLYFTEECERLKQLFLNLRYPMVLVETTISKFIAKHQQPTRPAPANESNNAPVRIVLPFEDQKSADIVRRQLIGLGKTLGRRLNQCSPAGRLPAKSVHQSRRHLLLTNNVLYINFNVTCAMQVMSAILADTYINALLNTKCLLLANT